MSGEQRARSCPRKAGPGPGWAGGRTFSLFLGQRHPRFQRIDITADLDLLPAILVPKPTPHTPYSLRGLPWDGCFPLQIERLPERGRGHLYL